MTDRSFYTFNEYIQKDGNPLARQSFCIFNEYIQKDGNPLARQSFYTFNEHIREDRETQIETFIELFHSNNEISGVKYNEFRLFDGRIDTIEYMFSEGRCGIGDIHNMIEPFKLISPTLNKLETGIIWYEYGQIMSKIYDWTKYLENETTKEEKNQPEFYSDFNKYMKSNWRKMLLYPTKHYTYAEQKNIILTNKSNHYETFKKNLE